MAAAQAIAPKTTAITRYNDNFIVEAPLKPSVSPKTAPRAIQINWTANVTLGRKIALESGLSDTQWECLYLLWGKHESGWNNHAQNPYSTAYGIAQFLDGTWAGTGYKKTSNPEIQIRAGLVYISNRYGTSCNALSYRLAKGWY